MGRPLLGRARDTKKRVQARLTQIPDAELRARRRWRMRGPTGKLISNLRKLETNLNGLEHAKGKGYKVGVFFAGMGFILPVIGGIGYGSVKGAQSRLLLEKFVETHKNHPRVAMFLAENTRNPYLKRAFRRQARQEIKLRILLRSSKKVKAMFEIALLNESNPSKAVDLTYKRALDRGFIEQSKEDLL